MSVTFVAYRYDSVRDYFAYVEDAPEVNVANATAAALLDALNLQNEPCGSIPPEAIPALRRRILVLIQGEARVAPFAVPGSETPATPTLSVVDGEGARIARRGTCAVVDFGVPVERLLHRMRELDEVAAFAQKGGFHFGWG